MSTLIGRLLDHYEIIERIGQGGMATVYRATDTRSGEEVAIKVLSPGIGDDRRFIKRFRREARLVSSLDHKYIVPVLAYGQSEGYIYTVMPFVRGESLHDRILSGEISNEEIARWIDQISQALTFAHSHGVIHRDIKPGNVMLDKNGNARLTDFGLARAIELPSSLTGSMLMGTPAYVSPEQGRGDTVDARSDQYSLGVILYELLTGRIPFDSESAMATVLQHIQEPVPRPRRFAKELNPDVEVVVLKALAKRMDNRFASVQAFNEAYQAANTGKPLPELGQLPPQPTRRIQAIEEDIGQETLAKPGPQPQTSRRGIRLGFIILPALVLIAAGAVWLVFYNSPETEPAATEPVGSVVDQTLVAHETEEPAPTALIQTESTPTAAPTPQYSSECPAVALYAPRFDEYEVSWLIDNGTVDQLILQDVLIQGWPAANGRLMQIRLGDTVLQEGPLVPDDAIEIGENEEFALESGNFTFFTLVSDFEPGRTGYALNLSFDKGCNLTGEW